MADTPVISSLDVESYCIPTDTPEKDGTLEWTSTTIVLVFVRAGDQTGIGYSYCARAAAALIAEILQPIVIGHDAMDVGGCWRNMLHRVRNLGRPGLCAMAISAVDSAMWDLKARLLGISMLDLFGAVRERVPVYGSGGFISYDEERLRKQILQWLDLGIRRVKMKIGAHSQEAERRVRVARDCAGEEVELFVDANGAYEVKQAIELAERLRESRVVWFEEPVSSDDLLGLRFVRERTPPGMAVSAGEYGYDEFYFERMLEAQAVDVLQADATRCCGITGFLKADVLASAFHRPLSSHCAPALHAHVCCAAQAVQHLEYFYDHVRIERLFFDGFLEPDAGSLAPDRSRPGHGLEFRSKDAARFRV